MTKILLVEDDKSLREIYGVRLLAEGYDIISAGDGEQALAMAIKERPALIVSDVMMPKISGFDMLDILRSTTETKTIKIIMMTALSSEDQRKRGEELGADRYLVKSQVGIEDVVRTVHEVLGDGPQQAAPVAPPQVSAAAAPSISVPPRAAAVSTPPSVTTPLPQPVVPMPAPVAPPQPELPKPTAQFSTPRPAGLGDRVIQPLSADPASAPADNIADLMASELSASTPPAPVVNTTVTPPSISTQAVTPMPPAQTVNPVAAVTPSAPPATQVPTPQQPAPTTPTTVDFEETPLPPIPPVPPAQ